MYQYDYLSDIARLEVRFTPEDRPQRTTCHSLGRVLNASENYGSREPPLYSPSFIDCDKSSRMRSCLESYRYR